jgi:hypothetical protein
MSDISSSIFIGVLSGIVTSLIIWLVVQVFKKVLLPSYQSITYQGLEISGTWIGLYVETTNPSTTDDPDLIISINQKGHIVDGTLIRNKIQDGTRDNKEFVLKGTFRDGNLVLSYKPKDNTRLGLGAYVLMLTNDGQKFEGLAVFVGSNNRAVSHFQTSWIRKNN